MFFLCSNGLLTTRRYRSLVTLFSSPDLLRWFVNYKKISQSCHSFLLDQSQATFGSTSKLAPITVRLRYATRFSSRSAFCAQVLGAAWPLHRMVPHGWSILTTNLVNPSP